MILDRKQLTKFIQEFLNFKFLKILKFPRIFETGKFPNREKEEGVKGNAIN
jgi:hypothetical protein